MNNTSLTKEALHPSVSINGITCNRYQIESVIELLVNSEKTYLQNVGEFLTQWFAPYDTITLKTSGTTGVPKEISVKKKYMIQSARLTGAFLKLRVGEVALCALPTEYIAGKMMIVRALVLGLSLEIVAPSSTPFASIVGDVDFVALTPMQAMKSLTELYRAKKIILGGAPISQDMETLLQEIPSEIYATYGMTETVSHIALRPISPKEKHSWRYITIGNITVEQDQRGCLVINALEVSDSRLVTNDVVELYGENAFEWKGRYDHIINSGGIKIFPESVENKIAPYLTDRFFIWKAPDNLLGERVILLVEAPEEKYPYLLSNLQKSTFLSRYELPKKVYFLPHFELTTSGKIRREATAKLVL